MSYDHRKNFAKLKKEVIESTGDGCAVCGTRLGRILHHMTYDNWGAEIKSDVLLVCGPCHGKLHGKEAGLI